MRLPSRGAAGLVGAALGVVAAGAAAGVAVERYAVGRTRLRPDPEAREPFGRLPADRTRIVVADDGVALHVEEVGPSDAPLTIVFTHGYCLRLEAWHYQRLGLADAGRLVFWDQRGHGRSERSAPEHCTIDQIGRDLARVVEAAAPRGPVVLVGHSMGGMTVMALADQHPEWFGDRVVAVGLLNTSAGGMAAVTLGLPAFLPRVFRRFVPVLQHGARTRTQWVERGRRLGTDLGFMLTRHFSFAGDDVSPALVEFVESMVSSVPVDVVADFYDTFMDHDKLAALPVLAACEVTVIGAADDLLTPVERSREIAAALPHARLEVLEQAGHAGMLERPALVNLHLRALVERARSRADGSRTGRHA